jgi:Domain of unknown function (DUF4760)
VTLQECIEALGGSAKGGVCAVSDSGWLNSTSAIASIFASIAIVATALFAWRQLSYLHTQITDARTSVEAQILANAKVNKLNETLQLIMQMQINEHWRGNRIQFIELRESKDGLKKHAHEKTEDATCIRNVLNQYELIAIGIHSNIIDEEMFRRYYRTTVINDWTACWEFIELERRGNLPFWVELETMVNSFKAARA